MKAAIVAVCALVLGGCSSVKVVQRDNCWVRQTKHFFATREELGPCGRPEPKWAHDRLTRITQECVAQADYRWQTRALAAWSRGEALPPQPDQDVIQRECMDAASRSELAENERLRKRVAELNGDKDAIAARAEKDHARLLETYGQIASDLGEAAQRSDAPATATANASSDGRATSEGRSASEGRTATEGTPAQSLVLTNAPGSAPVCAPPRSPAKRTSAPKANAKAPSSPPSDCPAPAAAVEATPATAPGDTKVPEKAEQDAVAAPKPASGTPVPAPPNAP